MKFFFIFLLPVFILACRNRSVSIQPHMDDDTDSGIYFAYSPIYTSGYSPGSYKNVKIVTDVWKEFENGDIMKLASSFADSVNFVYPDQTIRGKRDSVLREVKKIRDNYSAVQSFVYSWLPAKSEGHDDDWVFIWGKHELTGKQGKSRFVQVHEIWQFNEDGKIMYVQQYHTKG